MKVRNIVAAAGLMIAAMGVSGSAQAHPHRGDQRYADYHDNGRHRGWDRGDHRGWDRDDRRGWDRGRGYRHPRHCWTEWRHHRRVRVCR